MADPDGSTCSQCGAPLPADGLVGFCPRCLPSDTRGDKTEVPPSHLPSHGGASRKLVLASAVTANVAILLGGLWCGNSWGQEPADAVAHYKRGVALRDQGKLEEAIAEFRTAIRLRPDDPSAHIHLGITLAEQGELVQAHAKFGAPLDQRKFEEAIAEFRTAIRLKPDLAAAHYNLAVVLTEHGKLEEAVAEYREAIRLKPDDADAHKNLGRALQYQRKHEEAVAEYRAAIRLKPDDAGTHFDVGLELNQQGNADEAIAEFRAAIRLEPDSAIFHNTCAWALVVSPGPPRGDYAEGLAHARKAVKLAPKAELFSSTLALAEYRSGHWAESIAAAERSMAFRNGGRGSDRFVLAMARWQNGEKEDARRWFEKAVAWTKQRVPKNVELRRFWQEAAVLLGRPGPTL